MSESNTAEAPAPEAPEAILPAFDQSGPRTLDRIDEVGGSISAFASAQNYETAKKMATALSQAGMVPEAYRGKIANCLVAMELAGRTGASVFAVMQNLHIIQGKPSFSSAFLIGSVNACGRFTPLRFQSDGETGKAGWKCRAVAKDVKTGEVLEGVWVTWEMAQAEGWTTKAGSKWKTMPELMIRYRAAAFWTRLFAPEISLGMHTVDEVEDFAAPAGPTAGAVELNKVLTPVLATAKASTPAASPSDETIIILYPDSKDPNECDVCFRTDGTHDSDAPCAVD